MYQMCKATEEIPILLFWVFFAAIGLYGLVVWPFQAQYLRKHTFYVITNKKIYRQRGRKFDELTASNLPGYETVYRKNGNGSIKFAMIASPAWAGNQKIVTHFTLDNLPDMEHALQAIARMGTQS